MWTATGGDGAARSWHRRAMMSDRPREHAAPDRAGPRPGALAVLATAQLVLSLDYSIVNVALPSIGGSLGFSRDAVEWVVSAYALMFGGRRPGRGLRDSLCPAGRAGPGPGSRAWVGVTRDRDSRRRGSGPDERLPLDRAPIQESADAAPTASPPDALGRNAGHCRVHGVIRIAVLLPHAVPAVLAARDSADRRDELPAA